MEKEEVRRIIEEWIHFSDTDVDFLFKYRLKGVDLGTINDCANDILDELKLGSQTFKKEP